MIFPPIKNKGCLQDNAVNDKTAIVTIFFFGPAASERVKSSEKRAGDSVRLLLTINPACTCNCPWCQVHGIWLERFPRPPPDWRRHWLACTGTSDEQPRPGSEPPPSVHFANPRVPLGLVSYLEPVRHERLYRTTPRITDTHKPHHDDNVGALSAGLWRTLKEAYVQQWTAIGWWWRYRHCKV